MNTSNDLMELKQPGKNSTMAILKDLTTRLNQILTQNQTLTTTHDTIVVHIVIKLDGINYAIWDVYLR